MLYNRFVCGGNMIQSNVSYKEYLNKLKKNELINMINDYNNLCDIYKFSKIDNVTSKKNILVNLVNDVKDEYVKAIIMSLDINDYNILKKLIQKNNKNIISDDNTLVNLLIDKHVLWKKDVLEVPNDIDLKKILNDKTIKKHISYWTNVYKLVDGIVIAYGVVDINFFNKLIDGAMEKDNIFKMLNVYYKRNYLIDSSKVICTKLTNKKRIDKYFKDKKYKEFTIDEYIELGNSKYHHNIKAYKKFIKILKNYYVFKRKDIEFVDMNIVIPYLYNKINEEQNAKNSLEENVIELFEFKNDKLKKKMIKEIEKIKLEFPLWELRGYSIKERDSI